MTCPFKGLSRMSSISSTVDGVLNKSKGYVYAVPGIGSIQSIMDPMQLSSLVDPFSRHD
jgi:hypothetical protein